MKVEALEAMLERELLLEMYSDRDACKQRLLRFLAHMRRRNVGGRGDVISGNILTVKMMEINLL